MEISAINTSAAIAANPSFTVSRAALLPVLDIMARKIIERKIIERRNTIPILSYVLIEASPSGELRLTGTNLDMELEATIVAEVDQPGATTVCAFTLRDIVKKASSDAMIRIDAGDGRAMIYHGRGKQSLPTLPRDDFPIMAMRGDYTLSGEFDAVQLVADLSALKPAICKEETRYYLRGVFFELRDGKLCMAATNGHALHLIERADDGIVSDNFGGAIVHEDPIAAMLAILKGHGPDPVTLDMSASKYRLDCGDIVLRGKLIDGTFPDYRRVIPVTESLTATLSVEGKELLQHCEAAKGQDGKVKALRIECEGGAIRAGVSGVNGFARPLSAEFDGQEAYFSIDATYLTPLAKIGGAMELQSARLDGDTGAAPFLVKLPDMPEFTGVVMPVRDDGALPKPRPIAYVETLPAPGRAADLFGVDAAPENSKGLNALGKEGPRPATQKELEAYARDYAARLGLRQITVDWKMTIAKRDNLDRVVAVNFSDGRVATMAQSVTVLLPGYGQDRAPVTVQWQDDAGEYGEPQLCTDAKGKIALPDAPKERKGKKAKAAQAPIVKIQSERELRISNALAAGLSQADAEQEADEAIAAKTTPISEPAPAEPVSREYETPQSAPETQEPDAPATLAAPEPEIALSEPEIQPETTIKPCADPIADVLERLERLERALIINAPTNEAVEINMPPFVAMETDTPLSVQSKPKRSPAHIRAIMAYLRMRRERAKVAILEQVTTDACNRATNWEEAFACEQKWRVKAGMKRRRAVLLARDFQKRLYAEYAFADKRADRHRATVRRLTAERDAIQASRDRGIDKLWRKIDAMQPSRIAIAASHAPIVRIAA